MSNWQDEYEKKVVSAEEAVKVIKSGDYVVFAMGREPLSLGLALAARKEELKDVRISTPFPGRDFGWYDPGWEDSFSVELAYIIPMVQQIMMERRADYIPSDLFYQQSWVDRDLDVLLVEVTPPDKHGFCSFGASLWHKRKEVEKAKIVLAEENPNLIKTHGTNFVHISQLDYIVHHVPSGKMPGTTDMVGRKVRGPSDAEKTIAEYAASLVKDGDTIQLGGGSAAEFVGTAGALDNKLDLGSHTELATPGIINLLKNGVITGKKKTLHPGKVICTAAGGAKEHLDFIDQNPTFEIHDADYVLDPRVVAANDNMVSINSALAIDLTGQIAADSIGTTQIGGTGGQLAFAVGAKLSKGGRFIIVVTSTARGGTVSRIGTLLPHTVVTTPRTLADYVITEYGIAKLRGKTQRERALELISVAHPDFRADLNKEAKKLLWP